MPFCDSDSSSKKCIISGIFHLNKNDKEYHINLLFFHRRLRSMVDIELKIGEFKSEYAGKINFYLSLLDKFEKAPDENPSIGIILCAKKDHLEVELALQDVNKPIGVPSINTCFRRISCKNWLSIK